MPDAVSTQLSKAIVLSLAAATFSKPVTVKRVHVPEYDDQAESGITIMVAASSNEGEPATRAGIQEDHEIIVAICSPAKIKEPDGIDDLVYLVQEVKDHLLANSHLPNTSDSGLTTVSNALPYVPDLLTTKGTFLSIIECKYVVQR